MLAYNGEAVGLLRNLVGLNDYEARVYLALLKLGGPADAKSISESSGVPLQRVYDVLERMLGRETALVRKVQEKPKVYVAVSPEILLDLVLARRRLEL